MAVGLAADGEMGVRGRPGDLRDSVGRTFCAAEMLRDSLGAAERYMMTIVLRSNEEKKKLRFGRKMSRWKKSEESGRWSTKSFGATRRVNDTIIIDLTSGGGSKKQIRSKEAKE